MAGQFLFNLPVNISSNSMRFTERREFLYDPEVFKRLDVQTALKIHDEAVRKHAGKPWPKFFEVDRSAATVDPLWLQPTTERTKFLRTLDVPCIVQFEKKKWDMTRQGRPAQQRVKFWTSHKALHELDYFPIQGDLIYWDGYRLEITHVEFEPNAYWQQTNVWLGIIYGAQIVPQGDAKELANPQQAAPVELSRQGVQSQVLPHYK